jgi:hypothetical protein
MIKLYGEGKRLRLEAHGGDRRPGRERADVASDQEPPTRPSSCFIGSLGAIFVRDLRGAEPDAVGHDHPPDLAHVGLGGQDLQGDFNVPEFGKGSGRDQRARHLFNRMRRSLQKALKLIEK